MTYPAPEVIPHDPWFDEYWLPELGEDPSEPTRYQSRHQSTPDHERGAEAIVTMHEKMYRMATKNGTTLTMGGSENIQ